ncbi:MAG: TRAP transporter substrate-binding protein DctP [Deltaproteobacteria bacterium]|nr:TRAP transporter substrate-binding protein DctP [Deltaproteobacteria bacterium]
MKKLLFLTLFILTIMVTMVTIHGESSAKEVITLKVTHQWPQNPEDPLIATALKFTDAITKRTNGEVQFQFYPAQSLVKAGSAFQSMQKGVVDMSILPYIYASGVVPQLNFSQFVCGFDSHDSYFAWRKTKGYDFLEKKVNEAGVKSLVWLHYSVGLASKGKYIATPADAKGILGRANGVYPELLFTNAGAGITPMVSSEIYTAAQRGMIQAMVTSSSSMAGYKLFEVFDHYLSPLGPCIDYGMEPICISMKTWNNKLNDAQRKAFIDEINEAEEFGLARLKEYDKKVTKMFRDAGCKVREMTKEEFAQWKKLAKDKVWPEMIKKVPDAEFFFKTLPQD